MKAILACDDQWGIAKNNLLPWPASSEDFKWFKTNTAGATIIMGKSTWEASDMPKPLPGRYNIVLSRSGEVIDGDKADRIMTVDEFVAEHTTIEPDRNQWVIGGAQVLHMLMRKGLIDEILLTRFNGDYECDTFIHTDWLYQHFFCYTNTVIGTLNIEVYRRKTDHE
jgi:dihydrofolate reductase